MDLGNSCMYDRGSLLLIVPIWQSYIAAVEMSQGVVARKSKTRADHLTYPYR